MSILNNSLLLGADAGAVEYQIQRSLRFNSSDSAYLSRTPASAGNRKTWTWSAWAKPSNTDASGYFLFNAGGASNNSAIAFTNGTIDVYFFSGGGYVWRLNTTAVYRDFSAWYHIVFALDTSQATSSDRAKLYVNGTQVTIFSSALYPTLNYEGPINTAVLHNISGLNGANGFYYNGYLADIHFIDGQALTPSSFAETNITTGQWVPKAFTGTYGTNGFRLAFADNSNNTATTLGKDSSPNGNNWTPNNLSVTAGAGNDSLVDTPTSYGTDTGAGGEVRGNYATFNPLDNSTTLSDGNLSSSNSASSDSLCRATLGISSGKWYWEITNTTGGVSGSVATQIGIVNRSGPLNSYVGSSTGGYAIDTQNGNKYNNTVAGSYFSGASAVNSVHGVAFDADNGTLTIYRNGSTPGTAYSSIPAGTYFPAVSNYASSCVANFGQRQWAYQAPAGFKALCDTNLPAPVVAKPNSVFDVKLYTGTGSSQTISGLAFSPDLVWTKSRNNTFEHTLSDTVRGANKQLYSSLTNAETSNTDAITAFNSDGFTVGANGGTGFSSTTYVGWAWDAGSSTVTNTQGSITSQVRANASAGFSIVTYSQGSTNGTVGHGLGIAPAFIIVKSRTVSGTNWPCYHISLGKDLPLQLSTTSAQISASNYWGTTAPSATTFGVGTAGSQDNNNGDMVAYCFAPVAGYSSFGSYTGNGSADGPFVFCNFRPRWILIKETSGIGNWLLWDTSRSPSNVMDDILIPNSSSAEITDPSIYLDVLSNGFKIRSTSDDYNGNTGTFIYAAFAENPFQYARAR